MPLVKRKKKTIRARRRTGAAAAPVEKGFDSVLYYFQNEVDRKETIECTKSFIRITLNKTYAMHILANPDYNFGHSYMGAPSYCYTSAQEVSERSTDWHDSLVTRFKAYLAAGKTIHK